MLKPNKYGSLDLVDDETGEILDTGIFKTPNNHDRDQESANYALTCEEPTLTDQSFREDVDINTIVQRALRGEQMLVPPPEQFGDMTAVPTWLEIADIWANNSAHFYNLAPAIREEFLNQPARWMDAARRAMDKGDLEETKRIGIDLDNLQVIKPKPAAGAPAPRTEEVGGTPPVGVPTPPKGGQEASS